LYHYLAKFSFVLLFLPFRGFLRSTFFSKYFYHAGHGIAFSSLTGIAGGLLKINYGKDKNRNKENANGEKANRKTKSQNNGKKISGKDSGKAKNGKNETDNG
jgi:hypothetical protein